MSERYFFLLIIVLYVGIFGAGGWLVMQTDRRQFWRIRLAGAVSTLGKRFNFLQHRVSSGFIQKLSSLTSIAHLGCQAIRCHKGVAGVTLALLVFPVLIALCLSPLSALEAYVDVPDTTDPVIAALLHGEHLVPPSPLPPATFLAKDLEVLRPEIASASREWTLLDTDFRQRLLAVYQLMAKHGYQMALLEGYRSPERQAQLARLGPQVTNAGAYQSYHQYGLAADSAFYRDGKIVISEKDEWAMEGYRLYGKYADSVGLVWGGHWQMMDFGHVELRKARVRKHP